MRDFSVIFNRVRGEAGESALASLEGVPLNVERLCLSSKTKHLPLLPSLANLRYLSCYDMTEFSFAQVCEAQQVTHLTINAYGLTDLHLLANLVHLQFLDLTDNTKATSVEWLRHMPDLMILELANCPISVDLAPIADCPQIAYLWLSSSYSKPMRIPSLEPLRHLSKLERLRLTNVRVNDRKLEALHGLNQLAEIELPDFFTHKEFVALAKARPQASGRWLEIHKDRAEEKLVNRGAKS